ncbi:MAG: hypothetical protein MPW15_01990 [Candidatus Manganitrophus sp.]|nr:hypothetical protein [Candidatus Manganitrophus sp.]
MINAESPIDSGADHDGDGLSGKTAAPEDRQEQSAERREWRELTKE